MVSTRNLCCYPEEKRVSHFSKKCEEFSASGPRGPAGGVGTIVGTALLHPRGRPMYMEAITGQLCCWKPKTQVGQATLRTPDGGTYPHP